MIAPAPKPLPAPAGAKVLRLILTTQRHHGSRYESREVHAVARITPEFLEALCGEELVREWSKQPARGEVGCKGCLAELEKL